MKTLDYIFVVLPESVLQADKISMSCNSCYFLCGIVAVLIFIYLTITLVKPENF
jgi:hypothetical protein